MAISAIRFVTPSGAPAPAVLLRHLRQVTPAQGQQPVVQICAIRDEAYAALSRAGYIASVLIPAQEINTGELTLTIVTARLVGLTVRGDKTPYDRALAPRLAQLRALDPLNTKDAERILLLAGDIPGLDVQLDLRSAGGAPGEVIGDLAVRYRRGTVFANANNFGSSTIGRTTLFLKAERFGLTGNADTTFGVLSFTPDSKEQRVFQLGHTMALGSKGTALQTSFTYGTARPDLGALDLRSVSIIGRIEVTHPLIRSVGKNLITSVGAELIEQRTKIGSGDASLPLFRDKLRIAFARATGIVQRLNPNGGQDRSLVGSIELRQGLDVIDATTPGLIAASGFSPSRFEGRPNATVVRGEINAARHFQHGLVLRGTASGQWANKPLLSVEEFAAGNLTIGRGYDPGAAAGDRAVAFRGEVEKTVIDDARSRLALLAFGDLVRLWNLDTTGDRGGQNLRSVGAGLRIGFPRIGAIDAIYAHPLDAGAPGDGAKRPPDRLLVSFSTGF